MTILLYVLGVALFLVGIVGLVVPALPGGLFLVAGVAAIAWAEQFTRVTWLTVGAAVVIAILMSVVDFAAGALGAKRAGATKWGILGSMVGVLAGLFFGLPGIILGPILGAVLFEYVADPEFKKALKSGGGVALGFLLGTAGKLALAAILAGLVVAALFVP
jgi:uncharacterized protein YqgC (DUF456 family)